jgi:hypothetical protein
MLHAWPTVFCFNCPKILGDWSKFTKYIYTITIREIQAFLGRILLNYEELLLIGFCGNNCDTFCGTFLMRKLC